MPTDEKQMKAIQLFCTRSTGENRPSGPNDQAWVGLIRDISYFDFGKAMDEKRALVIAKVVRREFRNGGNWSQRLKGPGAHENILRVIREELENASEPKEGDVQFEKGQIVHHLELGLGKVLVKSGRNLIIFFKDQEQNPKTILARQSALEVVNGPADPWLENLEVSLTRTGELRQYYLTHKAAVDKFLRHFPGGFGDPKYRENERRYKWETHELWDARLGKSEFGRLLGEKAFAEIVHRCFRLSPKST